MTGANLRDRGRKQLVFALLLLVSFLLDQRPTLAQDETIDEPYWRHPAAQRVTHVIPADINQDGITEFLVAAENGTLEMLNANGATLAWSYDAGEDIQAIHAFDVDGDPGSPLEIALVSANQLTLLDSEGGKRWQIPMSAVNPPPASTTGVQSTLATWYEQFDLTALQILPISAVDGRREIVVLFSNGQLHWYDENGNLVRRINKQSLPSTANTQPHMQIGDLNRDGREEIVLGMFNVDKKFSEIYLIDYSGSDIWEDFPPFSGRITALTLVPFGPGDELQIAVGTDRGQLHLYNYDRQRQWWPRTLNKPITAVATALFPEGPALLVSTDAGMVVAYSNAGQRYWTRRLTNDAERPVIGLSTIDFAPGARSPVLAVVLGPDVEEGGNQQVKLLDSGGLEVRSFEAGEGFTNLTQLLDVNDDQHSELLLTRFANVELQGLGFGVTETAPEWDYSLDAAPGAVLVVDFDGDGRDELLIGAENGRLHYLRDGNELEWLHAPGGAITQLAVLEYEQPADTAAIVVARNNNESEEFNGNNASWIELRHTNGERIWEVPLATQIASLLVANGDTVGESEIFVGTSNGEILMLSETGNIAWRTTLSDDSIPRSITQLLLVDSPIGEPRIIAVTDEALYTTPVGSRFLPTPIAAFDTGPVRQVFNLNQPGGELAGRLLVMADDAHGLSWRGVEMPEWPLRLNGNPLSIIRADDPLQSAFETETSESFLIATDADELVRLSINDNQPEVQWVLGALENISSLYWGDLDGNRLAEFAVGDAEGKIRLFTSVPQATYLDELPVTGGVFAINALRRGSDNRSDLLVVTENGEVQLFSTQENNPPLLTGPTTEVTAGQYGFDVAVTDVEEDNVEVRLDIFNPETGEWEADRESVLGNGNGRASWSVVDPPANDKGVTYRFHYDDGSHTGYIYPPPGPAPISQGQFLTSGSGLALLVLLGGLVVTVLILRQLQSQSLRTRRFYWRLKREPAETLDRLERRYQSRGASPDFLLTLSGLARQRDDDLISSLVEGLYLQADHPTMGLPMIVDALEEAGQEMPRWEHLDRWLAIFRTGRELLSAPTLTELSLLWPELEELLQHLDKYSYFAPSLEVLHPALTTIRDSERVDRTEDRLVYLNEAAKVLDLTCAELPDYLTAIEKPVALALADRWAGLVSAEIEEMRGRAQLVVTLKTKRIVPDEPTQLTFTIHNDGRAPAENLIAVLDENPAYAAGGLPETISFLPPGHTRQVVFDVRPLVPDRFRASLSVTYDDRNQSDKQLAFGDEILVLSLQSDFHVIPNPYRPGTPLRQNSTVFYGREWFFDFIAENAGDWSERNALILIGQRRTGKTSALLNLEQHVPPHLLPVYIDCQSLGVSPGMAALFHDWAWLIADALTLRDIELEVPELDVWEREPTVILQRHFLPKVRSLLPPETTILLVFDEFEVFEHLVNDGILPPTFFNFLRHLMQHSDGLSFTFVGTHRLEEMSADYWSVMFNIALYRRISYLRDSSAMQLITEPVAPHLVYDDLALEKIMRVTAGHPYFLQLVCYTLVNQANRLRKGYVTISDVNAALGEMLNLGEVHFAYIWQRSSYTEQAILTAISHMLDRDDPFHPEDFVHFLDPYGIHLSPNEITAGLNTLVEREIMVTVRDGATTQYKLQLGLVGLWTAQHKSLSKLHARQGEQHGQNGKQSVQELTTG